MFSFHPHFLLKRFKTQHTLRECLDLNQIKIERLFGVLPPSRFDRNVADFSYNLIWWTKLIIKISIRLIPTDWDFILYPRRESNPNRRNRNPKFNPLNYEENS